MCPFDQKDATSKIDETKDNSHSNDDFHNRFILFHQFYQSWQFISIFYWGLFAHDRLNRIHDPIISKENKQAQWYGNYIHDDTKPSQNFGPRWKTKATTAMIYSAHSISMKNFGFVILLSLNFLTKQKIHKPYQSPKIYRKNNTKYWNWQINAVKCKIVR